MSIYRLARFALLSSVLVFLPVACGDSDDGGSTGPDPTGGVEVTLTIAGDAIDADGCVFTVDGGNSRRLLAGESTTYTGLSVGQHEVVISDVAGNCQVLGDATRSISVVADQTATATFAVTCAQDVGAMAISASTNGEDLDEDGYEIVVDGGAPSAIGINGSLTAGGLAPGDYSVALQGEAFNCSVGGNNPRTITVTGGAETQVTFDVTCRYHLYDRIAFQSYRTGTSMLYAIDPYDPASERALGVTGLHPAVSPDGLRIAYSHENDIWIVRSDGSGAARITDTAENEFEPTWSPDGNWIAYERENDVWTMRDDGSVQSYLKDNGRAPTWSPDGGRIAFESDHNFGDIDVIDADGSNHTRIVDWSGPDGQAAWSPLGNFIGFASARDGGGWHIFVVDPAGGTPVNMTIALIGQAQDPTWAPAAEAGAFSSDATGTYDIYYFVPGSLGVVRLTTDPGSDVHPSWGGGN